MGFNSIAMGFNCIAMGFNPWKKVLTHGKRFQQLHLK
jgi:hypothetical protein